MGSRWRLSHRPVVAAAALCMVAGAAFGAASDAVTAELDRASSLLRDGQAVRAKHVASRLDQSSLTDAQRERTIEILAAAERRLRNADPVDVSLQRASIALDEGDVRLAQRQAEAARGHAKATSDQRTEASALLQRCEDLKATLAPAVATTLLQAQADLEAGRLAEAKSGFDAVYRSGCRLPAEDLQALESGRDRIIEAERERGEVFELAYTPLGVLKPGQVEREPTTAPTTAMAMAQAEPPPAPEPAPEPVATTQAQAVEQAPAPAPAPAEPAPAGQEDLFQQALRFDAQRHLAEADSAFTEMRFNEAEQKYSLVTGSYRQYLSAEDLVRAEGRLTETRQMLSKPSGGLLGDVIGQKSLILQQAIAEYDNFMAQAQKALAEGAYEEARNRAGRARLSITDKRDVFSEKEYTDRITKQEALIQQIRDAEERARVAEAERQAADAARQKGDAESRQRAEKDRKIIENLDRIRQLQMEQKYTEALQVVDQVLFLDPTNPAGLLLKDVLRDVVIYREFNKIQRDKSLSFAVESNRRQEGLIIPDGIMSYPPDWPELSFRRGETAAYVDSEEDRRVLADLESRKIPASFAAHRLEDVLKFVETVTNLNMDVNWESLSGIGIERDAEVTLNLRAVPVRVVLDRVMEKVSRDQFSRSGWAVEDGVLVVASEESLRKKTFIKIYDIQDLVFKVPEFPDVPELDLDTVLQQTSQRGGGGGGGGIFNSNDTNDVQDIIEEERATLDLIKEIIQTNIDFDGWRDNGGDTGLIQELNGNLIITQTAKNHRSIVGLLSQLREVRSIQISVEARFLAVSQDFFEQIGFDLDVYFNAKNNQYRDVLDQERAFGGIGSPINPASRPGATGTLPSDLVGVGGTATTQYWFQSIDPATGRITYNYSPLNATVTAPDPLSIIPAQQGSAGLAEDLIGGSFASTILGVNPALGIAATFLDDVQVDLLVEATQADRRNVALTAPRLTFVNGRFANIFVATQRSFVSDLTPVVGNSSVAFDPTVSALTTGVTLLLRGVVSADRRYVTLMVDTRVAVPDGEDSEVVVQAATGGQGNAGGGSTATGTIQLPRIAISSVSTGATVPDQGTILLGGQRLVTESEVEVGVPVLSQLPIINRFFTNRIETKEERTLLILLKPTIIMQNEEEERNFPGLLDKLGAPGAR